MWQDVWTVMLRYTINDVDTPQQYADARLQTALLVGAQFVNNEFSFQTKYNIDLIAITISPDPTLGPNPDEWMTNLTVAKTAIIMLRNNLKLAAISAWMLKDVDVTVDTRQVANVMKMLLDDIERWYEEARAQYAVGVNPSVSAVLTPINIFAGGSRMPMVGYDSRSRMVW